MPKKEYSVQEIIEIINNSSYTNVFISEVAIIDLDYLNKVLSGKKTMGSGMKTKLINFIHTHIKD